MFPVLAPAAGFEPATLRLTVESSTAELRRNGQDGLKARLDLHGGALMGVGCVMGPPVGFEPTRSGLQRRCSTRLS